VAQLLAELACYATDTASAWGVDARAAEIGGRSWVGERDDVAVDR
jgi:hypothetical protein